MNLPDFISVVPVEPIVSPCVNICRIGKDRLCEGCRRTVQEVARWTSMTSAERDQVMAELSSGQAESHSTETLPRLDRG